ncbi:antibiotic biosynthesis monooxygenase family protein [Terrarubrum flagellatum]|uniref:antibiotic biosynthesis monooxygenase family protein n=1 Tax=Terrirubrum flagellatum TaxID=2895980 RepID=UPI003144F77E
MIVREWKGYAIGGAVDAYATHLRDSVAPQLSKLDGFRGASLAKRAMGAETELLVTTRWDSMESVRAFAGDSPDIAVVEPAARAVLSRFDATVAHYEVMWDV